MAVDQPEFAFENPGYCACCRQSTTFRAYQEWLRDFYVCTRCGSVPRQRHVQTVLDEHFPGWESRSIHESSPSHDFIARYCSDYSSSQFFPGAEPGSAVDGIRSENVEDLTYPDESFDLFVTQDVLEHVFHPDRAIAEIHRVLRPGGAHVFTAPKHKHLLETVRRATIDDAGRVDHLLPEEYHGNPIGDNRALVTFDYGYDFERLLSTWAGVSVTAVQTVDRARGLDAEHNEVFVIAKPGTPGPSAPSSFGDDARALARRAERRAVRALQSARARITR